MKTKSEVLKEFEQLLRLKYSSDTVRNYVYQTSLFLSYSKNVPSRITNEDFLNYNIYLSKQDISDSTRNVAINAVKAFFKNYLRKKVKNFASIRPKKAKYIPRAINHDLLIKKIASIDNIKHRLMMKLGYGCGLRSGELINLEHRNIDVETRFINVKGKGKKERLVPFSEDVLFEMLNYFEYYNPKIYLFNGQRGEKYSKSSLRQIVKDHIGDFRFHDLRHSYATRLLETGLDLKIIKDLLGHEHLKTTEIYTHVSNRMLSKVNCPL